MRRLDKNDEKNNPTTNGDAKNSKTGVGKREKMVLSVYEQKIVTEVVAPEDIHVSFNG